MSELLGAIAELNRLKSQLAELTHRVYGLQIGVVVDNRDPLNLRRIKVAPQSKGGQAALEWLMHCNPDPIRDAPIPPVGSTVYYQFLDGDPHDGVWLGVTHNDTNPPDPLQGDPVNDSAVEIPGNDRRTVTGDRVDQVGGDRIEEVTKNFTLDIGEAMHVTTNEGEITITAKTDFITITGTTGVRIEDGSGAFLEISGGVIRLGNAQGQDWQLGGGTGTAWNWDIAGGSVNVVNANDFKINNKSAIVVGSTDSDGDVNNSRGY
jgi:hypothetical protein